MKTRTKNLSNPLFVKRDKTKSPFDEGGLGGFAFNRLLRVARSGKSKEGQLFGVVVKDGTAVKGWRDRLFVANHRIEIGLRFELGLDGSNKLIQTAEAVELVSVAEFCSIEGNSQPVEGLIVGFQRNRKRMAVFAAMGERKTRGISETAWRAMDDFGDQRE